MKKKDTLYQTAFTILALYLIFLMLRYPALALEYASTGLNLWFTKMVPTLLPFMILSGIMIRMHLTEHFVRLLHPLLHFLYGSSKNGSYTIIMGFLCGFPMGARIVGELCEANELSPEEGASLLYFCNNIGPIYFLSYVVPTLGLEKPMIPLLIMYGIPLLYGLMLMRIQPILQSAQSCLRKAMPSDRNISYSASANISKMVEKQLDYYVKPTFDKQNPPISSKKTSLLSAVDSAILSGLIGIAKLGGYMVFFNLLNILFTPFQQVSPAVLNVYRCLLEITSGIDCSGQSIPFVVLILLPFGGFSCIAQTYSMIRKTGLSIPSYVFHKTIQTALTAVCYLLILL